MTDLFKMPGPAIIEWMYETGHPTAGVYAFASHGITDTVVIDARIGMSEIVAALPDDARIAAADLDMLELIGPRAWYEDPENRDDWAVAAQTLSELKASLDRRDPTYRRYNDPTPHEVLAALLDAGRGPTYVHRMVEIGERYCVNAGVFGFEISPIQFSDLLEAGVRTAENLGDYQHTGLSLAEIVEFASEGIPAGAIMQAQIEGIHRSAWKETLAGLPRSWFVHTQMGLNTKFAAREYFINASDKRDYTLADLRYLADRGWDDSAPLYTWGLSSTLLPLTPENSKYAANFGLTWRTVEDYGKALNTGKTPRSSSDTCVAPIIGGGGGKAWGIRLEHVGQIAALVEAGVKPSHITAYRSAGCRTIDDIVTAAKAGITHKYAKDLTKRYGRKPSKHHNVYVFDSFRQLLVAADKDLENKPS